MQVLAVPTLVMHLVHAVELDPAVVDLVAQHLVHAPVGPLGVRPHGRRKHQHAGARVSDHLEVHVLVE
jgi:hypothetical protein